MNVNYPQVKSLKPLLIVLICCLFLFTGKISAQQLNFTASVDSGCAPLSIQFSGNQSGQSYLWDFGDGATSVLPTPSHVYMNPGSYTVKLSTGNDSLVRTNYITVLADPAANFQVSNSAVCQNSMLVNFTNTSQNAGNFIWDFGDGTTSAQANPSHLYPNSGNYTVQLIASNGLGCSDLKVMNNAVQVMPQPAIDFSASSTTLCIPLNQTTFTNMTPSSASLTWNFGDGTSSSSVGPNHTYSAPGSYNVTLIVTSTNGCSDTLTKSSYITVVPMSTTTISADTTTGCLPLTVHFTASAGSSYLWNFGTGATSAAASPAFTYTAPGNYNVSVTITKSNGCIETAQVSNLISIPDTATALFAVDATSGCAPLVVHFTNQSTNATSYLWNFGDGHHSTLTNPTNTYNNIAPNTVILKAFNSAGCPSTYTYTTTIASSSPNAGFTAPQLSNCAPFSVTFNNVSSLGATTYLWDFGDGTNSALFAPTHIYTSPGTYSVKLVAYNTSGCADTATRINYLTVINTTVNSTSVDTLTGCAPYSISMSDSTFGANSWLWNFGDGTQSTLRNPTHTYSQEGMYTITLNIGLNGGCTQFYPVFKRVRVNTVNAGFTYSYNCVTQTISFIDTTANVANNTWNFYDGTTSSQLNPLHTYPASGAYNISLSVTNTFGCTEMLSFVNLLHVTLCGGTPPPSNGLIPPANGQPNPAGGGTTGGTPPDNRIHGCAPLDVNFSYPLTNGTFVRWEFGDNSSSTSQSIEHTYPNAGVYTVLLVYQNILGMPDTIKYDNLITLSKPEAQFSVNLNSNCVQYSVSTTNNSVNAHQYLWNFGDGATSTNPNPTHTYNGNEIDYTISLSVTDTASGCTSQQSSTIFLSNNNLIWANKYSGCANVPLLFFFSSASYQSYSWDFGDGTTAGIQNPSHAFAAAGNYLVKLTVVDAFGCSRIFELPQNILINQPIADFSYVRSGNCSNYSINFINQSVPTNLGVGGSCLWSFGDGLTSAQYTPVVTHVYAHPGTYTVRLTILTSGGCVNIIDKVVEVGLLEADFVMQQNRNCFPMSVSFTDQTGSATSWEWNFGNGQSSALQNPTINFTQLPTDSVRLIVTDNRGCKDTLYKKDFHLFTNSLQLSIDSTCVNTPVAFNSPEDSISVVWNFGDGTSSSALNAQHAYTSAGTFTVQMTSTDVNGCVSNADTTIYTSAPVSQFITMDTVGCAPKFVHFINTSVGSHTYSWNFGDGSGSTNANPSHIYNTPGVYDVKLISFSSLGCADTLIMPNYVRVIGPVVSFTLTNDTICASNDIDLQLHYSNVANWQWNFGDGATSSDTAVSHIYTTPGHYVITVIVHDTHGCSTFFADSSLFVSGNPIAHFTVDTLLHCAPVSVQFNNQSTGAVNYAWNFGNSTSSVATQPPMTSYTSAGTYTSSLIAYNSLGCSDTAKTVVQIAQAPTAAFHATHTSMCLGTTFNLVTTSTDTIAPQYHWTISPGFSSSAVSPLVTLPGSGSHDVTLVVTNSNGCRDTLIMPGYIIVADSLAPEADPIKVVSVSSDTSILIKWMQATCNDFKAYILYKKNNSTGGFSPIDTITDINTTQYTDRWLNTLHHTYTYKLQTLDICGNAKSLEELTPHRSIEITAHVLPNNSIQVTWNAYSGCNVSGYKVERSETGNAFAEIATVPASQTSYTDSTGYCPVKYIYRISAQQVCGANEVSMSDTSAAKPANNFLNQKVDVIRSTVVNNSSVLTEWAPPVVLPNSVAGYKIYRKTGNHTYSFVDNAPAEATSYVDTDVDVNSGTYEYKILVVNYCNMATGQGDEGESILLEVHQHDLETDLKWTPYTKWGTGVEKYIIERKNANGQWEQIKTVDGATTETTLEGE